MREFQAQKKQQASFNKVLNSKWSLVVLLIMLIFLIRGNIRVFKNYFHVKDKYEEDVRLQSNLKTREVQLNKDMDRLKTDQGMDYEIRKKLDVSAPDEKVIKIIDKK
jgi:cell division protein FtsB